MKDNKKFNKEMIKIIQYHYHNKMLKIQKISKII
jgi:hypothetical protein